MWITGTLDHVDCVDYGYSGLCIQWIIAYIVRDADPIILVGGRKIAACVKTIV